MKDSQEADPVPEEEKRFFFFVPINHCEIRFKKATSLKLNYLEILHRHSRSPEDESERS